ncbi:hypothetical protein GCM10017784_08180 [Deinococcus indicus]|uniref:polymorphic toxin-type HINT domain-containing protein n=1 Tax=Deinococcus indicus TaxID=223556 RepID=UPI0019A03274|nr:polymorphic toxin-type HINT domain-containing protein [Deinococcus indicus]GHG19374.1 hypothetical protein GCM10017784_08180 [Deinococcus indicus]
MGAGHLKIGDQIKQADGTIGLVANVTTPGQTREMFNLTVSEAHTYYVGQDGWLVHNESRSPVETYDRFNYVYGPPENLEQKALDIVHQLSSGANRVIYYNGNGLTRVAIEMGGSIHKDKAAKQSITMSNMRIKQDKLM